MAQTFQWGEVVEGKVHMIPIFHIWNEDSMNTLLVATYRDRADAEARAAQINADARAWFTRVALNGAQRANAEPWRWRTARVTMGELL